MNIYEVKPEGAVLDTLTELSAEWESESITHGYAKSGREYIAKNRVFVAEEGGRIVGYLFGHAETAAETSAVIAKGTPFFEVEELYVLPEFRSRGVGRKLYRFAEDAAKSDGARYTTLSTATKDWRRILHFYLDELGMEFWTAQLFKRL